MEKTTMSVQELSAQMGISLPKAYTTEVRRRKRVSQHRIFRR